MTEQNKTRVVNRKNRIRVNRRSALRRGRYWPGMLINIRFDTKSQHKTQWISFWNN
jgi:hypothetical protein